MSWADKIRMLTYFKSNPEWYYYESEDEDAIPKLTDKAPPKAVESYRIWKEWYDEQIETGNVIM